jgi:hypothetical protein
MLCHHYCNEPLRCPECIRRFWKWAENHTRGRRQSVHAVFSAPAHTSFYEAAAKFADVDARARREGQKEMSAAIVAGGHTL